METLTQMENNFISEIHSMENEVKQEIHGIKRISSYLKKEIDALKVEEGVLIKFL